MTFYITKIYFITYKTGWYEPRLSISQKSVRPELVEGQFMVRQAHHYGFLRIFSSNGQSRLITDVKVQDGACSNELLLGNGYVVHGVKHCVLFEPHCFAVVKVLNYHLCGN